MTVKWLLREDTLDMTFNIAFNWKKSHIICTTR
jgi:hypothetical protein